MNNNTFYNFSAQYNRKYIVLIIILKICIFLLKRMKMYFYYVLNKSFKFKNTKDTSNDLINIIYNIQGCSFAIHLSILF